MPFTDPADLLVEPRRDNNGKPAADERSPLRPPAAAAAVSAEPGADPALDPAAEGEPGGAERQASAEDEQTLSVSSAGATPPNFIGPSTFDITTPAGPSGRERPAATYDVASNVTVLFGGCTAASPCASAQTWTWDGAYWQQRKPTVSPPARYGATLAYLPASKHSVLFGGYAADGSRLADTWTWDGGNWTQRFPSISPPARADATAALSAVSGKVVLFGGAGSSGALSDTWLWDGTSWAQGPAGPPARSLSALADTGRSQGVLLYGGRGASGGKLEDTWTFDGTGWLQHFPASWPGPLERHAATFNPDTDSTNLSGGVGTDFSSELWAWTGTNWWRGGRALTLSENGDQGIADAALVRAPKDGLLHVGGLVGTSSSHSLSDKGYLRSYMPIGRPSYASFDEQRLSDRVSVGVNRANAGAVVSVTDLRLSGVNGLDVVLDRHWSSLGGAASPTMHYRWRYDLLDTTLYSTPGSSLVMGPLQGQHLLFTFDGVNTYTGPPGSDLTGSRNSAGQWVMTNGRAQLTYLFDHGKLTRITDRNGNTLTMAQSNDRTTSLTDSHGRTTTFAYDRHPQKLSKITDPSGRTVTFEDFWTADTYQLRATTRAADGTVTDLNIVEEPAADTAANQVTVTTGASTSNPTATRVSFGALNRTQKLTRITDPSAGTGPSWTYTPVEHPQLRVVDPRGHVTTYTADRKGPSSITRVARVVDALGHAHQLTHDKRGNVTASADALGAVSTARYDGLDNLEFTRAPDVPGLGASSGRTTTHTYTTPGLPYARTTSIDSDGHTTTFGYDGPGNLLSSSRDGGPSGAVEERFTVNPPAGQAPVCGGKPGQRCTATDGRGKTTHYAYNSAGDLLRITPPAPLGATTFTYDAVGRVATRTDGKNQTTGYSYDTADRVTQTRYAGTTSCTASDVAAGTCLTSRYDGNGNLIEQRDQHGTVTLTYDRLNRELTRSGPRSTDTTITQTWDDTSNLTSLTEASGTTRYGYDKNNQLISLAEPGTSCPTDGSKAAGCTRFGYNPNGVRTTTTYPTSTSTVLTVTPDNSDRIEKITAKTGMTTHVDLAFTYQRDVNGTATDGALIRTRTGSEKPDTFASTTTSYSYDTLARLHRAVETNSAGSTTASWMYCYDPAGNRTLDVTNPAATATCANTAHNTVYNDANQITSRNGSSAFSYDGNGAEVSAVGATTRTGGSWNAKQQLTSVTAGSTTVPFTYTGQGNQTRLTNGSTSYRNTGVGITAHTSGSTSTSYVREPDGTLVATRIGANSYYYLFDHLGSVIGLVDAAGGRANTYRYDPYGKARTVSQATGVHNLYRYTGGLLDGATGLYKLGLRYYDPTLGRFTQPDPTGQDPHYTYARNNPCNYTDPTGANAACFISVTSIIGGVAGIIGGSIATAGTAGLAAVPGVSAAVAGGAALAGGIVGAGEYC